MFVIGGYSKQKHAEKSDFRQTYIEAGKREKVYTDPEDKTEYKKCIIAHFGIEDKYQGNADFKFRLHEKEGLCIWEDGKPENDCT